MSLCMNHELRNQFRDIAPLFRRPPDRLVFEWLCLVLDLFPELLNELDDGILLHLLLDYQLPESLRLLSLLLLLLMLELLLLF